MATTTTAQPSVCVPTEPEWVTEVLNWHKPCTKLPFMYTAPENMRLADIDDHIFEPVLVSIGPFHHGKFPAMAEHKTRLLSSMLDRHGNMDGRKLLMELVDAVRSVEEKARGYYSKSFREIDFVKIMVLDGCFLLEIFRIFSMKEEMDPLRMARWMLPALALDILKVRVNWRQGNPLEIEYRNGVLGIPILLIDHSTKILMRNMVAYEQCNKAVPDIFTSYVIFMDALVNSAEDVEVLRMAGVVDHSMKSSEEVSKLLNDLTANLEIDMNEGYLADLNEKIYNDHHKAWPQLKVCFKRLVNSREGMAYIITVLALYLTVLQTVFTVLSYFLPR